MWEVVNIQGVKYTYESPVMYRGTFDECCRWVAAQPDQYKYDVYPSSDTTPAPLKEVRRKKATFSWE